MARGAHLAAVGERDVQLDDEVAVSGQIDRSGRTLAPFDDPGEDKGGELALGIALIDARPHRGALDGLLPDGERMQKAEPAGIGDPL